MGFLDSEIKETSQILARTRGVDAVKGCGAMGVDTVLVIGDKSREEEIIEDVSGLRWDFICSQKDLSFGDDLIPGSYR